MTNLHKGDQILSINGVDYSESTQWAQALHDIYSYYKQEDPVTLYVCHDEKVTLKIEEVRSRGLSQEEHHCI